MDAIPAVQQRAAGPSRPGYALLFTALFGVLLLLFVFSVADVLLLLFVAALFGLYLGAITDFLQHRARLPRGVGILVALVLTALALIGVGWLVVPPMLSQTQALLADLPGLMAVWESSLRGFVARYPIFGGMFGTPDAGAGYFDSVIASVGGYFAGVFPYLFSGLHVLINLVSVLVMGVYLALRPALYRDGILALVPHLHKDLVRDVLADLASTLRAWIVGQIAAMVILGGLTWAGLWMLGVPYALAFGVFTGLVALVPFFGTLVSTLLPALFVLGSGGPWLAFWVIVLGIAVHLLEANFVAPIIMERQVHMPPVLSILSVLVMAELLGVVGLLVAVPTLATVMVIIRRIYIHRLLEGRGFRRTVRDAPVEIRLPRGAVLAPAGAEGISVPAVLEESGGP